MLGWFPIDRIEESSGVVSVHEVFVFANAEAEWTS